MHGAGHDGEGEGEGESNNGGSSSNSSSSGKQTRGAYCMYTCRRAERESWVEGGRPDWGFTRGRRWEVDGIEFDFVSFEIDSFEVPAQCIILSFASTSLFGT